MPPRRIQQDARAEYVGVNEVLWRIDAAIDMRFSSEVDDRVKLVLGQQRIHLVGIGNVGLEEFVAIATFFGHAGKVVQVAGVGERINIRHVRRLVMFQNVANKVAPNETAAAGH